MYRFWDKIILLVINKEIYNAENNDAFFINLFFAFMLCVVVVFGIKIAGVLLIPSLLIIPGLIVHKLVFKTITSLLFSALIAVFATVFGVVFSMVIDVPTGPLITLILVVLLVLKFVYLKFLRD
jgi:ABC-type Mn2+/Zn2+ transport system permease subunit